MLISDLKAPGSPSIMKFAAAAAALGDEAHAVVQRELQIIASDLHSSVRGALTDVTTFPAHAAVHGMVTAHSNGGIDPAHRRRF